MMSLRSINNISKSDQLQKYRPRSVLEYPRKYPQVMLELYKPEFIMQYSYFFKTFEVEGLNVRCTNTVQETCSDCCLLSFYGVWAYLSNDGTYNTPHSNILVFHVFHECHE